MINVIAPACSLAKNNEVTKWKLLRYAVIGVVAAAAVWQICPYLGDALSLFRSKRLNYWWMVLAVAAQMMQYANDGYITRKLYALLGYPIKLSHAVRIAALDIFAIHFLPVGSFGSFLALIYFYRKIGVRPRVVAYLNIFLGYVGVLVLWILFIISSAASRGTTFTVPVNLYVLGAAAIIVPAMAIVLVMALHEQVFRAAFEAALSRYRWYVRLQQGLDHLRNLLALAALHRLKFIAWSVAKNSINYLCDILTLWACSLVVHAEVSILLFMLGYVVAIVVGFISLSPGGLGASDAAMSLMLIAAGVHPATALDIVLLNAVVAIIFPLPLGALAYISLTHELGRAGKRYERPLQRLLE